MTTTPPPPGHPLDPFTQARLDRLYWETDIPVRAIAAELGIDGTVSQLVTPKPAGFHCYLCGTEFVQTSRSARNPNLMVTCRVCRNRRTPPGARGAVDPLSLPLGRAVIAVRASDTDEIDSCVYALGRVGIGWDGRSLVVVHPDTGAQALGAALAVFERGTLAIPSLRDLGDTQSDRLQTLWAVTRAGWRVIAAHNCTIEHGIDHWDLRHLEDSVYEPDSWHHESAMPIRSPLLARLLDETSHDDPRRRWGQRLPQDSPSPPGIA
jgi:hypothetical protein